MKKFTLLLGLLSLCLNAAAQDRDSLLVMFWNLENFFEPGDSMAPPSWTNKRFHSKCQSIAKTILLAGETEGRLPDAVGFAEVGNGNVLKKLLYSTCLAKLDYRPIHFESPDRRGIDCALLYRTSSLSLLNAEPVHLQDSSGRLLHTRDLLVCVFDRITVIVNHHPSKLGSGSQENRRIAMHIMNAVADSLVGLGHKVISMGDFNDTLWGSGRPGTIKYNGRWEKIDGAFSFDGASFRESVFSCPDIIEKDNAHGGYKPRRTFNGPAYNGGVSDHFPVLFTIFVDNLDTSN